MWGISGDKDATVYTEYYIDKETNLIKSVSISMFGPLESALKKKASEMGKNSNNTEAFHIINNFHINIENTYNNVNSIEKSDEVTEETDGVNNGKF